MRPILIATPAYNHHSAGIRVLHTLWRELNRHGRTAHLLFYQFMENGGVNFYPSDADDHYMPDTADLPRLRNGTELSTLHMLIGESVVIYPEVIRGNPLQAPRVARYVLNSAAANKYEMFQAPQDFIFTFNSRYFANAHAQLVLLIDEPEFHDRDTRPALERTLDSTYVGKAFLHGDCFKVPGSLMVERTWPSDKESLACILRHTRYFFTWDPLTKTNDDAVRCGAIPVIMRWHPYGPDVMQTDFGEVPHAEALLDNGRLIVRHNAETYAEKRRIFLDNYARLAAGNSERVAELAERLEQYFSP